MMWVPGRVQRNIIMRRVSDFGGEVDGAKGVMLITVARALIPLNRLLPLRHASTSAAYLCG